MSLRFGEGLSSYDIIRATTTDMPTILLESQERESFSFRKSLQRLHDRDNTWFELQSWTNKDFFENP